MVLKIVIIILVKSPQDKIHPLIKILISPTIQKLILYNFRQDSSIYQRFFVPNLVEIF